MYGYLHSLHEKKCSTLVKRKLLRLSACMFRQKAFRVTLFIRSNQVICFKISARFLTIGDKQTFVYGNIICNILPLDDSTMYIKNSTTVFARLYHYLSSLDGFQIFR